MRRPSILTGALAAAALAAVVVVGLGVLEGTDGPAEARAQAAGDTSAAATGTVPGDEPSATGALAAEPGDTLTNAEQAIQAHVRAERGPQQPIPFNHRWHVDQIGMDCAYCHGQTGEIGAVVTMPSTELCMGCHQWVGRNLAPIGELRAAWENDETIAWERVYKVPEFVQFNHRAHLRNEIACEECHGPVEQMDRVYKFSDLSMGWCLQCHRGDPEPTDVATNHLLVRDADFPDVPDGRQDLGLYPRRIHSGYAANRAPQDCATCHY